MKTQSTPRQTDLWTQPTKGTVDTKQKNLLLSLVENGADEESEEEGDVYLARPGRSIAEAPVEKGSASTIFQSKIYGKTYDKESSEKPVSK